MRGPSFAPPGAEPAGGFLDAAPANAPPDAAPVAPPEALTVAIGDPGEANVRGIPFRLSESVTAYVAS
ncbi:hypothetical protein QE410_000142 [Microbacterium sp. SORGH_AS 1204]|uniref:hypothetical protein n=1 Tax=Microbacterium sp. SORGH_AS_1204 TaxID=3041785 RepID=UPI0027914DE3|nr:hypothetical protein [Microbacterium sp. SORGH_AS_1204]MDQ1135343.1 hypothetical protein [Microbacterium sp. SORGH_AS_1204]